jgi:hypothetical protein
MVYPKTLRLPCPYTASNTEFALSEGLVEELIEFTVLSSSWTKCADCDGALVSIVCDGEGEFFRSL